MFWQPPATAGASVKMSKEKVMLKSRQKVRVERLWRIRDAYRVYQGLTLAIKLPCYHNTDNEIRDILNSVTLHVEPWPKWEEMHG